MAAKAFPIKVSEALAGAASETSMCERVKRRVKNESAIERTPRRNMGDEMTARIAPPRPEWARMRSRSPIFRMAPAVRTSPATAVAATARIVAQVRAELGGGAAVTRLVRFGRGADLKG